MRFPGFEGEWVETNFSEIGTFYKGKGISKEQLTESGFPCILYGELYTKYKNEVIDEVHSRTSIDTIGLVTSKVNDIIIPSSGESAIDIAKACCVNLDDVFLGGDLNIIRPLKDNGNFISYQLNGKRKLDIAKIAQGSSVTHLYNDGLKKLKIYLPKKVHEQDKIANLLSLCDKRISTQSKIIEELGLLKKSISKKLLSARLRLINHTESHYEKWTVKELGDLCEIVMGQSPDSSSYNTFEKGMPLIQGKADIVNRFTKPRNWTTHFTKTCHIGDLILTVRAPVGSIALSLHNACIGRGVCAIRKKSENSLMFIYHYLIGYEDKWGGLEQGSTFTAVSGNEIKKIKINVPSFAEQLVIANALSAFDQKVNLEKALLHLYKAQKEHLSANLFI